MLQLCSLVLYNTMIAPNFLQACQEDRHASLQTVHAIKQKRNTSSVVLNSFLRFYILIRPIFYRDASQSSVTSFLAKQKRNEAMYASLIEICAAAERDPGVSACALGWLKSR